MTDSSDTRDLVHILGAHAAGLDYDDLPLGAREAAKLSVLDTLGVIAAATGMEPAAQGVLRSVLETCRRPARSAVDHVNQTLR